MIFQYLMYAFVHTHTHKHTHTHTHTYIYKYVCSHTQEKWRIKFLLPKKIIFLYDVKLSSDISFHILHLPMCHRHHDFSVK